MGGFSDNYECGYWDDDTPPHKVKKVDKKKIYKERRASNYCYLNVLLDNEEHELPRDLDLEVLLELRHHKDKEDAKALAIYHDEILLGVVQKVFESEEMDNTQIVNEFCFFYDKLKKLDAFWDGMGFYLRSEK